MQQNIPSGRLKMYGISSDNHAALCQVHALPNDQKPYQNTTATGPEGKDDYSKWTYTFDPYYSLVRNGTNQLVSKIVCHYNDGINSTAYNKINVTGMALATADLINQTQQPTGIVPTFANTASEASLPPSAEQLVVSPAQEKPIEKTKTQLRLLLIMLLDLNYLLALSFFLTHNWRALSERRKPVICTAFDKQVHAYTITGSH